MLIKITLALSMAVAIITVAPASIGTSFAQCVPFDGPLDLLAGT
jgi:hypothetical protein